MLALRILLFLFLSVSSVQLYSQEICNNGIDDDADGLVDLNDEEDCDCSNLGGSNEVESLIPNASFEETNCCPQFLGELDCADTWIQASTPTSDYFNTCDFVTDAVPLPMADGEACVGCIFYEGWAEYVGACTDEPLIAGTEYLISFDVASNLTDGAINFTGVNDLGPVDIVLYGSPNCGDLPWATTGCPTESGSGDWEVIGSVNYDPLGTWSTVTIEAETTVDCNAIALGPPCDLPDLYNNTIYAYFFFDNLILNEASLFDSNISEVNYNIEYDATVEGGVYIDPDTGDEIPLGPICSDEIELVASLDSIGGYQWFYDGVALSGETDTVLTMDIEDVEYGNYQFMLTLSTGCGIATYELIEPEYPTADFSVQNTCFPDDVEFFDESTFDLGIIDWEWYFGDGGFLIDQNPTHFFDEEGPHDVTLISTGGNFCKDTIVQPLVFNPDPIASFEMELACEGQVTAFTNLSTIESGSTIVDWDWDFGDTNVANNTENPTNTFIDDQEYMVTLLVTSDDGCEDEIVIPVQAYSTPVPSFSSDPVCIESPNAVFINTSTIPEGSISEYNWDFGDTQNSTNINPNNVYSEPGEYIVTLEAVSNFGCVGTTNGPQLVSHVTTDFSYDLVADCSPYCAEFEAIPVTDFGAITDLYWEFSNGETSIVDEPEICFQNGSHTDVIKYDVKLTAMNNYGCIGIVEVPDLIEVWPVPLASFDASPDRTDILSSEIKTTNLSIGATNYYWDFGDGYTSDEFDPIHIYEDALIFPIELIVESDYGCLDTALKRIDILPVYNIYIPNSFSPQQDGINEVIYPVIEGGVVEEYSFVIRNRWNDVVFETNDSDAYWNGSYFNNNEYYVEDGLYVYEITVKFERLLEPYESIGTITVFR